MNIALIAQDPKKELMVTFCTAYSGVLKNHKLCATASTGKMVSDATGLHIINYLSGSQGGCQQIASLVSCREIDMVILLRDSAHLEFASRGEDDLLRLCDIHLVPFATNIATAEALIHSLERGDLDWRNVGKPVLEN
ncbi:MAG: methylglyoxal synthase [Clostridia bacterium]|nr:methylglyoxal synthase [Clostridia bacterium]MBR2734793.1 methylglyoxal synthase [Clostridia bacterium]